MLRTVVIGTGFLGRAVVRCFSDIGAEVAHTYHSRKSSFSDPVQFDLFAQDMVEVFQMPTTDLVVFAMKIEDLLNTPAVTETMSRAFRQCQDKRVVYISSDAVFDGRMGRYTEIDVPNPITIYGKHKKLCEDLIRELVPNHCIVRTSYIYGFSLGKLDDRLSNATALVRAKQNVHKFVDMFKSPVEVNQLTEIIVRVSQSKFRGILHASGPRMSIYDFFKHALDALGEGCEYLLPDHIPELPPPECLIDTSLDSTLLKNAFGIEPVPVAVALRNSNCSASLANRGRLQSIVNSA